MASIVICTPDSSSNHNKINMKNLHKIPPKSTKLRLFKTFFLNYTILMGTILICTSNSPGNNYNTAIKNWYNIYLKKY